MIRPCWWCDVAMVTLQASLSWVEASDECEANGDGDGV